MDSPVERHHSEQTAREIDQEVRRIFDEAIEKTRHILATRRSSLESLAGRLIEKEVIDAVELKEIIDANSRSPVIVPGTEGERKRPLTHEPSDQQESGKAENIGS
jgi:cell division protease FtsH